MRALVLGTGAQGRRGSDRSNVTWESLSAFPSQPLSLIVAGQAASGPVSVPARAITTTRFGSRGAAGWQLASSTQVSLTLL